MYLRGKYKYKHNKEINKMLQRKMKGDVYQEECADIIQYMYNEEDSAILLDRLSPLYRNPREGLKKT